MRGCFIIKAEYYSGSKLVYKYIKSVFPKVDNELKHWSAVCKTMQDSMLSRQASSSISSKKFHAQGGSAYALYPNTDMISAIKFIVSLQTISDYLDNLCDRAGIKEESAFRQLHLSMLDAVDPQRPISDYYRFYPYKHDGGYLKRLVEACRRQITNLPSYSLVIEKIKKYVQLYTDLQSYKHLSIEIREDYLKTWSNYYIKQYPGISCWEFSAASGSTLGMFILFVSAFDPKLTSAEVAAIDSAYFPWICGLHILLDYYIDSQEDLQMGDLNFTYYYNTLKECEERLSFFIGKSLEQCTQLRYPKFHSTIVKGLLAMYLSDPKASFGLNRVASASILKRSERQTIKYYRICKALRMVNIL